MKHIVNVGLIGFGTVGTGVAKILLKKRLSSPENGIAGIKLARIADLDITSDRGVQTPAGMLTTDAAAILDDPDIGIVVELIGGYEPARTFTLRAFAAGKSVVTANKALIARHGQELFQAAADAGVSYMFEASVAGGIPIIRSITDGLNANVIESIYGILNGTTNYILTGMTRDGQDYDDVLKRAQELGYAEADPTSDVSGGDALNKLVILCRLAFGAELDVEDVFREGIEHVSIEDIEVADGLGYTIKLMAIARKHPGNRFEARVHPAFIPSSSVMASVDDEFNAVEIVGDAVGRQVFYGKGAGMMPTASAVVSDVISIAARLKAGIPPKTRPVGAVEHPPVLIDMPELKLRYYLRFNVLDRPGVLAAITKIFAEENISIDSVIQMRPDDSNNVPLVITTHEALEGAMRRSLRKFRELDSVKGDVQVIRVEDLL